MKTLTLIGAIFIIAFVHSEEQNEANVPEALQDLQTEFWLPYSVTEDVDFTILRPEAYGCYLWSVEEDKIDLVNLDPVMSDYTMRCGTKLDFQILPKGPDQSVDIKITGENMYTEETDGFKEGVPEVVEYTIHIRPVAKLEVMGLRTELTVGGEPAPFGVAGYDAEENEFDTLDGLQISWYIGAKRPVAEFEKYMQKGPISKVIPTGGGSGVVIAILSDPNYKDTLDMATMEITVTSEFSFSPDTVYLLEGADVEMKVLEKLRDDYQEVEMGTQGKGKDEFYLDIKDPQIATLDRKTGKITGLGEGETTLYVRNMEGEVVKGQPIWVVRPKRIEILSHPFPKSKQLMNEHIYDIKVDIYDKDDHLIYPSKNILAWSQYPDNFEVLDIDDSMLNAKIKANGQGLAKVKVALRSVLNELDEETEILPHIKAAKDFEIYEPVTLQPFFTILPWDENTKPNYEVFFKAAGGSKAYSYSVSDSELATIDNEGKLDTHGGPGELRVKAFMPKSPDNHFESRVSILPPIRIEFTEKEIEQTTGSMIQLNLKMTTFLPEEGQEIMFTNCADVPYEIKLSDEENFEVINRSNKTNPSGLNHCAYFNINAKPKIVKENLKCTVFVKYYEPTSGRTLRARTVVSIYNKLQTVWPEPRKTDVSQQQRRLFLPIGSSLDVAFRGGPYPKFGQPFDHFQKVIDDAPEVIRAVRKDEACGKVDEEKQTWDDLNVVTVTCLTEGTGNFALMVGNYLREESKDAKPQRNHIETEVICSIPHKVSLLASGPQESSAKHPKKGFVGANNKEAHVLVTAKDKDGHTFDTTESLVFETKVDDEDLVEVKENGFVIPKKQFETISVPEGKPFQVLVPKGQDGSVEVSVKLKGYNEEVLAKNDVKNAKPLPKVLDEDEMDEEEEPIDEENYSTTLIDYVTINFASQQEIEKIKKSNP